LETTLEPPNNIRVTTANGQQMIVRGEALFQLDLEVHKENINFYIVKELRNEIIIGTEALYILGITLDFQYEKMRFGGTIESIPIFYKENSMEEPRMLHIRRETLIL
jgi:hypothetical protein